ncbi:MAG TPA: NUDIX domain-containing protein [Nitrospirae bacterium]|nr:NUDIX domain-containing protein [Nitrospirota bacterium]
MPKISAGILLYRKRDKNLEVFLVHPGGPLWAKKDEGVWSIPKGLIEEGEDLLQAAIREFEEETGFKIKAKKVIPLKPVKQKGGKIVHAFAIEGDCDPEKLRSNTFSMEWPPHSKRIQHFPEIDRGQWFSPDEAKKKINPAQAALLDELERIVEK